MIKNFFLFVIAALVLVACGQRPSENLEVDMDDVVANLSSEETGGVYLEDSLGDLSIDLIEPFKDNSSEANFLNSLSEKSIHLLV